MAGITDHLLPVCWLSWFKENPYSGTVSILILSISAFSWRCRNSQWENLWVKACQKKIVHFVW